jgi:hypothetical protein
MDYDDQGVGMAGPGTGRRGRQRPSRLAGEGEAAAGGGARPGACPEDARGADVAHLKLGYAGSQVCSEQGAHHAACRAPAVAGNCGVSSQHACAVQSLMSLHAGVGLAGPRQPQEELQCRRAAKCSAG